jgi:hypothetical protein
LGAITGHYERRRPEETTLYRLVREHLETFLAKVEAGGAASLPRFVKDEFDAFLACGILAHGFLPLRCATCAHEKLVAFSCKRRAADTCAVVLSQRFGAAANLNIHLHCLVLEGVYRRTECWYPG